MMRKLLLTTITLFLLCANLPDELIAQEIPRKSPNAIVEQRVGLTDITIAYCRPAMMDRPIWGNVVPHGEIWRTGDNEATTISFTDDVTIQNKIVPAGMYSLYSIPHEKVWIIILNKKTGLQGTEGYNEKEDLLRIKAKPEDANFSERMTFGFENIEFGSADLVLNWGKLKVAFEIQVEFDEKAMANIKKAIAEARDDKTRARVFSTGAQYCAETGNHLKEGLKWIQSAREYDKENWYYWWLEGKLLAGLNKIGKAIQSASLAIKYGEAHFSVEGKKFVYRPEIMKDIEVWRKNAN